VTEQSETSTSEGDLPRIAVRRLSTVKDLTTRQIIRSVRITAADHPIRTISIAVVDDATITLLNKRYLNDDRATDVLAFDLRDDPEGASLDGEIVVSAETARREAKRLGLTEAEEVIRYIIHGTLHLLGHRDKTAAQRRQMRLEEDRTLAALDRSARAAHHNPRKQAEDARL